MQPPSTPPIGADSCLRMLKEKMAKETGVAPEHAGNRVMEGGPVMDIGASTEQGQGTLHPLSWPAYNSMLNYYNERMETQGIEASDTQIAKLTELLYAKRKVPLRFGELQVRLAARLISARVAYAEQHGVGLATVTTQDLEESPEGVQHWLDQVDPSVRGDATENVVRVADAKETAMRISSVLDDREEWLCANGLDSGTVMDMEQRDEFLTWSVDKFLDDPGNWVPDESYLDCLSRFIREQERRVGSTEIWELLSHTGRASPEDLRIAFKDHKESGSAAERASTPTVSPPRPSARKPRPSSSKRRKLTGNDYGSPMSPRPSSRQRPNR